MNEMGKQVVDMGEDAFFFKECVTSSKELTITVNTVGTVVTQWMKKIRKKKSPLVLGD